MTWEKVCVEMMVGVGYCLHCGAKMSVAPGGAARLRVEGKDLCVYVELQCAVCGYEEVGLCLARNVSRGTNSVR
jgi:hypothetical protein